MGFKERPLGGEAKSRKPTEGTGEERHGQWLRGVFEGTESQAHNAGFPQREGTSFTFDSEKVKSPIR